MKYTEFDLEFEGHSINQIEYFSASDGSKINQYVIDRQHGITRQYNTLDGVKAQVLLNNFVALRSKLSHRYKFYDLKPKIMHVTIAMHKQFDEMAKYTYFRNDFEIGEDYIFVESGEEYGYSVDAYTLKEYTKKLEEALELIKEQTNATTH